MCIASILIISTNLIPNNIKIRYKELFYTIAIIYFIINKILKQSMTRLLVDEY
jgi:hypothetical protein